VLVGEPMSAILEARDATLRYASDGPDVVNQVSLDVHAGDAIGIVGESGSGKSSLARMLVGALEPTAGSVVVDGRPWHEVLRSDPQRRGVQMVFQDPYGSLNPRRSAIETVAEVLKVSRGLSGPAAASGAAELLFEVGLPADSFTRRSTHLSGGQCQRVGIARALACEPKVLIADEPTSALDVSVQAQILNLLKDLRERRGLALVLISHDLGVIHYATEQTYVMYAGRIVESGATDEVFAYPSHHYTRALLASLPENAGYEFIERDIESVGCSFARRCPAMSAECCATVPPLEVTTGDRRVACFHPADEEDGPIHISDAKRTSS
jgi:oligopeptide/dipeptide ABC transporter ATP-binding protein